MADATESPDKLLEEAIAARRAGKLARSADLLDRVIAAVPNHPLPLRLRARVALEQGEADALARFDAALHLDPGNADLHLGKAQALEQAGDLKGAEIVAAQIAQQAPGFIEALSFYSSLLLAKGEANFASPFAEAARKAPQDPNIASAHCDALAGIDRFAEAADIAAAARARFPQEEHFGLLEAMHSGSAGEWVRAEALYAELEVQSPQRWLAEARHRFRASDVEEASALIDRALDVNDADIAAWALKGLTWRLSDAPEDQRRARWLHEQIGLIQFRPLAGAPDLVHRVRQVLEELHAYSGMPLSQSLRGGSQTRGNLLQRTEPEFAEMRQAILETVEAYRLELPKADPAHPLLRHRDEMWRLAGSWSVRLQGGGDHHASHIHPAGLLSSALYVSLPAQLGGSQKQGLKQGWLELGRPPSDLGLDIEPLAMIEPVEGHLALFPSTLYHGTRPFNGTPNAARMTVAFDIVAH